MVPEKMTKSMQNHSLEMSDDNYVLQIYFNKIIVQISNKPWGETMFEPYLLL